MPSVTYNGQSFAIDNRRFWIVGASIQYARIPSSQWAQRIEAAKQAGFNTIETACPWSIHEPRRDRFALSGDQDVRAFISLCAKAGMRVILRPGPYVGAGFDGGGLPAWLTHLPGVALREGNELFLERVNVYFRKLLGELEDLQATNGGPILLVQSEHAWLCSNREQADKYLREVTRVIRESGFNVPIINANDFWQESPGTIDTWRGRDDLLGNLRQLRTVQPEAPRLLSAFNAAETPCWGVPCESSLSSTDLLYNLAQCLAAGTQPVVSPFHGGTNFGFLGGRLSGGADQFVATTAAGHAPLGEAGWRGEQYNTVKRIATFANHFGSLFAELSPDYHPIVLDMPGASPATGGRKKREASGVSVVSLRGSQGRVVFVFADEPGRKANLLLENGVRMPVNLGDQRTAWFVLDADINGSGRIDYANLCPFAMVNRTTVILQGPEGEVGYLSINGTPLQGKVPTGDKPLVLEHKGITVVICNQRQIDATYFDRASVYVGVLGLDDQGKPIASPNVKTAWTVKPDGSLEKLAGADTAAAPPSRRRTIALRQWHASPAGTYVSGESPRFASLDGPQTLTECGAPTGYGWYAVRFRSSAGHKRLCHLPHVADRAHLAINGEPQGVIGVGPGAKPAPIELKVPKGDHVLTALVDNLGRFSEGNDLAEVKGLFGHIYEVKAMRAAKPKQVAGEAFDPFKFRGFIAGRSKGQLSETTHACWSFTHSKKLPIIIDIAGAAASGTLLLNDEPLAYYPGATAGCMMKLLISRDTHESFKRGKNTLRFAPDPRQDDALGEISRCLTLYEAVDALSESAAWSFAKWEVPDRSTFEEVAKTAARQYRNTPCWWMTSFTAPRSSLVPLWFETIGLSKGQVFVNGRNLGRYFTATATGKAVGPQSRLFIPHDWLEAGDANELLIFDEHGFDPCRSRLVIDGRGDLD